MISNCQLGLLKSKSWWRKTKWLADSTLLSVVVRNSTGSSHMYILSGKTAFIIAFSIFDLVGYAIEWKCIHSTRDIFLSSVSFNRSPSGTPLVGACSHTHTCELPLGPLKLQVPSWGWHMCAKFQNKGRIRVTHPVLVSIEFLCRSIVHASCTESPCQSRILVQHFCR